MSGNLYTLNQIKRVFGQREVLSIDHLELEPGLIYGLLGPNGSGKTTLMKILAFLDEPSSGTLFFQGRDITGDDRQRLRSQVVWSPQFPVMFTGSLRYNVEFPMKLKGFDSASRRRRSDELLDQVGLSDLAEAPAHRLSGGEAQRASLARALATEAKVLLLDEPTANVDAASRQGLVTLIEDLWRERDLSIIITTHDHSLEAELCRRRIHLHDGKLSSVDEAVIYLAGLHKEDDQLILQLPPSARIFAGPLSIKEITTQGLDILIKANAPDRRVLTARISGESDRVLAGRLSLSDVLVARQQLQN